MNRYLKIVLIVLGVIIGIILLDSIQSIVFNNSPILSVDGNCNRKVGLLVETHHCGEKKISKFRFTTEDNCSVVCYDYFEREIKDNMTKILELDGGIYSNSYHYIENDYYKNIVNLGKDAVPVIVSMYKSGEFGTGLPAYISAMAVEEISGCDIRSVYNVNWSNAEEFYNLWEDYNCNSK